MLSLDDDVRLTAKPFQVIDYPEGVLLKRGNRQLIVSGSGAAEKVLIILLSTSGKSSSRRELLELFATTDREGIRSLVGEMCQAGLLIPEEAVSSNMQEEPLDVFLGQMGLTQQKVIDRLSDLKILLGGVNTLTHAIHSNLTALGVNNMVVYDDPLLRNHSYFDEEGNLLEEVDPGFRQIVLKAPAFREHVQRDLPSCVIAASDFGGQALLLKWNQFCLQNRIHFLPVYLQDMIGYIGPLIVPGETACLHCVRQRQNSHLHDLVLRDLVEQNATDGQSVAGYHPSAIGVLAHTAVFELTHFFGKMPFPRPDRLIRVDLISGTTQSKKVLKIPRCPECSKLNLTAETQIRKLNPMPGQ